MTRAIMSSQLGYAKDATEQPLCPACHGGRLHPYSVTFEFPTVINGLHFTSERVDWLEGWVAVCVGNASYRRDIVAQYAKVGETYEPEDEVPPCGFAMPLTPKRRTTP